MRNYTKNRKCFVLFSKVSAETFEGLDILVHDSGQACLTVQRDVEVLVPGSAEGVAIVRVIRVGKDLKGAAPADGQRLDGVLKFPIAPVEPSREALGLARPVVEGSVPVVQSAVFVVVDNAVSLRKVGLKSKHS